LCEFRGIRLESASFRSDSLTKLSGTYQICQNLQPARLRADSNSAQMAGFRARVELASRLPLAIPDNPVITESEYGFAP